MIQDTSLEAWREAQKHLSETQKTVYEAIKEEPSTNAELAERLQWPINRITPRTLELRQKNLVEYGGKTKCKVTGRTAYIWQAKSPIALPPPFKVKEKEPARLL